MLADRRKAVVLISALTAHLLVTDLVWRDIGRRRPAELRGGPTLWRTLTALNTGNSLLYLLAGRRSS